MSKKILLTIVMVFLAAQVSFAQGFRPSFSDIKDISDKSDLKWEDLDYRIYNPNGSKYEFVRDYISALGYFQAIKNRHDNESSAQANYKNNAAMIDAFMDNLYLDNTDIRIAQNTLARYEKSSNAFIKKAIKIFIASCDGQIAINNQERELWLEVYGAEVIDKTGIIDIPKFTREHEKLAKEREGDLEEILKSSMIVTQVLVSDSLDENGKHSSLALTDEQRQKLMEKINKLFPSPEEGVRSGQSYLQASISAILGVLKDPNWKNFASK